MVIEKLDKIIKTTTAKQKYIGVRIIRNDNRTASYSGHIFFIQIIMIIPIFHM